MPALLFDWNMQGFNDTAVANCRNGVPNQDRAAIISNLIEHGATNYENMNVLFIFRDGHAIGGWGANIEVNLPWYCRSYSLLSVFWLL